MGRNTLSGKKGLIGGQAPSRLVRFVITNRDYGGLCNSWRRSLPTKSSTSVEIRTYRAWPKIALGKAPKGTDLTTFFISRIRDIPDRLPGEAIAGSESKHLLFAEGLPVEAIASRLPRLAIRDPRRLHIAKTLEVGRLLYRLVAGNLDAGCSHRIVDAWVEGDVLILLSPTFDRLAVPLVKLEPFLGRSSDVMTAFEIDEDGSFLYWPHADAHLGWEQVVRLVDPVSLLAGKQKQQAFNERYGAAIRAVRDTAGLKQAAVAGVTDRHLRRVEAGAIAASRAVLQSLAQAHRLSLDAYLEKLAEQMEALDARRRVPPE